MSEKNFSRCNTRHTYPWGKSCQISPYLRYREEVDKFLEEHKDFKNVGITRDDDELSQWLTEAVRQSKLESHNLIEQVEDRIQASMNEKFNRLENLMTQRVHTEYQYWDDTVRQPPQAPIEARSPELSDSAQARRGARLPVSGGVKLPRSKFQAKCREGHFKKSNQT